METCSICLEKLDNVDISKTICKHSFHTSCLLKWIISKTTCPVCRHTLVTKPESQKIYIDPLDSMLDEPIINSESFRNYMG